MASFPGYQNFQDIPAGDIPANQPIHQTPHNPERIKIERRTEPTTEKTKYIKDSYTNVQSPFDNKHPDTPKVRPRTCIDERPAKKQTPRKSFNPPPIYRASSSPSRLDQIIHKDRHSRGSSGRRSMEKSPYRNPSRRNTSDVGLKSDTLPAVQDTFQPAEPREFYLFVSNLSPSCADGMDNLNNYVEAGSSTIVLEDKVIYDQDKACAVLVLGSKPDMDKLKKKTKCRPLDEHTISVCEIDPPNAIVVSCEGDIAIDNLTFYFEVAKSGVVQSVCAKESHILDGKTLRVSPCYSCELGTIWDTKIHALPIPEPVTIPIQKSHAQYLKRQCLAQLEDQVKNDCCTIDIQNQSIILTCGLKPGVDNFRQKLKTWSNTVFPLVKDFITEHVKDRQITLDGSVCEELAEFINSDQLGTSDLVIDLDEHKRLLTLTGSHDKITEYEKILVNKMDAIERQNRRQYLTKHFKTGVQLLPSIQGQIMNELQTKCSDFDIEFNEDGVKVSFVPEDVDETYVKIYELLREVKKEKYGHKLSDNCVGFVNKTEAVKSKIESQIKEAKIEATWQLDHHRLTVEVVKGEPETVRKIIMEQIKETEINLPKGGYQFMKTGDSYEFLNDLIEEYDDKADIVEDDAKAVIRVCGLMETVDEICDKVKRYVNENAIQHHHVPCQSHHINFLSKHGEQAIEQIERDLAEYKVKVNLKGTSINIFASLKGMDKAKQEVQTMLGTILHEDYTIKKVNVFEVMKGSQVIQELEKETRCVIKLQKEFEQLVNVSASDSAEHEDVQLSGGFRRSKTPTEVTAGPIKITVIVASLEKQQVDCVLVGANETLNLDISGAPKSLANAARGTILQDECKNKLGNRLGEGQVAEIGAGKLPFKSVFLTMLPPAREDSEEQLTSVLQSFLQKAEAKKYQSVAIPALGTGYLKYSKHDVCKCFFNTVSSWGQQHPLTTITDVRFVMFHKDHDTIEIFQKYAARKVNASRRERNFSSPGEYHGNKPRKEPSIRITSSGCHIRQVWVRVQLGDILESDADGVVSSCSPDLMLNGAVSSILKSKSPNLETDCQKKRDKFKQHGIAAIRVKNFPFKNITFVAFQDSLSGLRNIMIKCLEKANKKKWKSVAFPVLGSGQGIITFKPECIAECLFEAIDEFSKKYPKSVTKEVRMIVFHKQLEMMTSILATLHQQASKAPSSVFDKMYGFIAEKCQDVFGPTRGILTAEERKERADKMSSMSMTIYSDDTTNIKQCQRKLDEKLEKSYIENKIVNQKDIIKSLRPEQRKALIDVPNLVNLRLDDNTGVITVYGCTKDVMDVTDILQSKLRDIAREKYEEETATMMFEQVQWCCEEITDTETKLVPYDKRSNWRIEHAYRNKQMTFELPPNSDGNVLVICFDDLIEYVKGDKDDQVRVVRKDILKSMGAALPIDWVEMGEKETIKVIPMLQTDSRFKDVSTRFMTGVKGGGYKDRIQFKLNTLTITKISRIQSKTLYQQYVANKKKIENEKKSLPPTMPVERLLWHGATQESSSSIISHGFNRSYCGKNGVWFGQGVYFAGDASYSARGWLTGPDKGRSGQTVTGYIFLVLVLTGHYCKGVPYMRYLGSIPGNPKVLYDSAVDDLKNPVEFVIFSDTQAYPEYLIEFTAVQK